MTLRMYRVPNCRGQKGQTKVVYVMVAAIGLGDRKESPPTLAIGLSLDG